jgi:hypothetical protein
MAARALCRTVSVAPAADSLMESAVPRALS